MKYIITDKTLKEIKSIQEGFEDYNLPQARAAIALKYAVEDIEAGELDVKYESPVVTPNGTDEKQRVMTATYEAGGGQ